MAALTANRDTPSQEIGLKGYPVAASTKIYKGSIVGINAAGYLVPGSALALRIKGVAEEFVDNSAPGANGAKTCRVRSGRAFDFAATAVTQAMLGTTMNVVDDQTVDDAAGPSVGPMCEFISATRVMVFIPFGGQVA